MSQLRSGLELVSAPAVARELARPRLHLSNTALVLLRRHAAAIVVATASLVWVAVFGYLSIVRHLAGGSHAEDLGFTDQVIWNFLRGQWFRMSLYNGATWNTELDLSHLARPDSLLAFHVEPMLLGFVPLYVLGAGPLALLTIQAIGFALGAIPAYRLGQHFSRSATAAVAVGLSYLLSPFGQSAVLSDFHTSVLAVPLLLLALERLLVANRPTHALIAAALALSAREDVGPVLALLGVSLLTRKRGPALAMLALGTAWTLVCALVLAHYSGGISPFSSRYAGAFGLGVVSTFLLSGGWLALLSPLSILAALPTLLVDGLSSSPWMTAGKAHYGVLLLPPLVLAAAVGLSRLGRWRHVGVLLLVLTSAIAYAAEGAGPLAANYAPATITDHAQIAQRMAESLPADAAVSASTSLLPRISHRARLRLFPSLEDADYVFLDTRATSAPTSPRDVYLRVRGMLDSGSWRVTSSEDGLLLLERGDAATGANEPTPSNATSFAPPELLSAALVPSPDGAIDVDGPHWILRTTWRTTQPLPAGARLEFWLSLTGEERHVWDIADVWWNPPEQWIPGTAVSVDIPDVPVHRFKSWYAQFSAP